MNRTLRIGRTGLHWLGLSLAVVYLPCPARGDVKLPSLFTSHMVLQRDQKDRVWGKAAADEEVKVTLSGHPTKSTKAGADGKWSVTLDPIPAGGPYTLTVEGNNKVALDDVLVGEVWLCSGQSNMQMSLGGTTDADLEALTAKHPNIRLISVPSLGTQEPRDDFRGSWQLCTPASARDFSAVGYFFGRQLEETLGVPVGLINDSWGGSACESWVRRDILEKDPKFRPLIERWEKIEKDYPEAKSAYEKAAAEWKEVAAKAKAEGKKAPNAPQNPGVQMSGNARPGNIYNGVLKPTIGYGIKGAIWYQGESNAGRAYQYRDLFPLMIKSWRDEWGIGDFSFYWVQLADFLAEKPDPAESDWAELREAQTMTLDRLPNTGEAVIIDLGEGRDIHPRNKYGVALRLARIALAHDYKVEVPHHSPRYKTMERGVGKLILSFDHVGPGLYTFDVNEPRGFAVAGSDRKFVWAKAKLSGKDKIEVWSQAVPHPVAVRYAWADNPVCNVYSRTGLPLTPFRTDSWPGVTADRN